jgi:hypothetical protein
MPVLNKDLQSIVNYDSRGKWGSSKYPGNTTGYLLKDLFTHFAPRSVLDPMEGSGTTREVCEEMGLGYLGYDLHGSYIQGVDILSPKSQRQIAGDVDHSFPEGMDFIFWHPPYWSMITYNRGDNRDFSSGPYPLYLTRMQAAMKFLRSLIIEDLPMARLAIQLGDLRKRGQYYWIPRDVADPSRLRETGWNLTDLVIRQQQGVTSNDTQYGHLIRIMHETVLILEPAKRNA